MAIDGTVQRVAADLEHGRVLPAIQRLRSLVHAYPERLDLRSRLADVYRSQGERAQAGRWSFLAEDADEADLAAFERAFLTARGRLAALSWKGGAETLGPRASDRLTALRADAATERGDDPQESTRVGRILGNLGCALGVAIMLLAALGFVACVVQGVRVVVGWF